MFCDFLVTISKQFCPGDCAQVMTTNPKPNKTLKVSGGGSRQTPPLPRPFLAAPQSVRTPCRVPQAGGRRLLAVSLRGVARESGGGLRRRLGGWGGRPRLGWAARPGPRRPGGPAPTVPQLLRRGRALASGLRSRAGSSVHCGLCSSKPCPHGARPRAGCPAFLSLRCLCRSRAGTAGPRAAHVGRGLAERGRRSPRSPLRDWPGLLPPCA